MLFLSLYFLSLSLHSLAPNSGLHFLKRSVQMDHSPTLSLTVVEYKASKSQGNSSRLKEYHILDSGQRYAKVLLNSATNVHSIRLEDTVVDSMVQEQLTKVQESAFLSLCNHILPKSKYFILDIKEGDKTFPQYQKDPQVRLLFDVRHIGENKFLFTPKKESLLPNEEKSLQEEHGELVTKLQKTILGAHSITVMQKDTQDLYEAWMAEAILPEQNFEKAVLESEWDIVAQCTKRISHGVALQGSLENLEIIRLINNKLQRKDQSEEFQSHFLIFVVCYQKSILNQIHQLSKKESLTTREKRALVQSLEDFRKALRSNQQLTTDTESSIKRIMKSIMAKRSEQAEPNLLGKPQASVEETKIITSQTPTTTELPELEFVGWSTAGGAKQSPEGGQNKTFDTGESKTRSPLGKATRLNQTQPFRLIAPRRTNSTTHVLKQGNVVVGQTEVNISEGTLTYFLSPIVQQDLPPAIQKALFYKLIEPMTEVIRRNGSVTLEIHTDSGSAVENLFYTDKALQELFDIHLVGYNKFQFSPKKSADYSSLEIEFQQRIQQANQKDTTPEEKIRLEAIVSIAGKIPHHTPHQPQPHSQKPFNIHLLKSKKVQ